MPTYDYVCGACGHEFEKFQSMNDEPIKGCPKCRKRKAKRRIGTGAGIIFKGSGFYETDYKRAGREKKTESSVSKSETDSSSKSESKPKGESAADSGKSATKKAGS